MVLYTYARDCNSFGLVRLVRTYLVAEDDPPGTIALLYSTYLGYQSVYVCCSRTLCIYIYISLYIGSI